MGDILNIKNLKIGYPNQTVLEGINVNLPQGAYLAIVGENGSGKTTLMKTILGLIKPLSGEFKLNINGQTIGYLPQQTMTQSDFPASINEVVMSGFVGRKHSLFYSKEQKEEASKNIELMGLADLKDKSFKELSGGQKQRVLLARALCATKEILLLDEPVTGLDPDATMMMYEIVNHLNKRGTTIIMITHDVEGVLPYATHILSLGEKAEFYPNLKKEDKAHE